ncbi:MAG TPA: TetR/AcrR family transcriptional regulator [Acidimicrobiales bacterium]|nr:TetR/AcrR family transcriptional regulator [Acidimicrobiales bacterium]
MPATADATPDAKGEATRQRLIEAGRRLIADQGYAGTTAAQIAEAAGVSERTFFRHFSSKSDVFLANWQHIAAASRTAMQSQAYRAPLIEVVRAGMENFAEGLQQAVEENPPASMADYAMTLPVLPMLQVVIELETAVANELARRLDRSDEDLDIRIVANTSIGVLRACGRVYGVTDRAEPLPDLVSDHLDRLQGLFDRLEERPMA